MSFAFLLRLIKGANFKVVSIDPRNAFECHHASNSL
jgi:hypothetical protein